MLWLWLSKNIIEAVKKLELKNCLAKTYGENKTRHECSAHNDWGTERQQEMA